MSFSIRRHPIFDELDAALAGLVPSEPVELAGSWLPAARRTYERAKQLGSGGPFIDVIDWRWRGHLSCATPLVAVAFLVTSGECFWSKSAPPQLQLKADLSFHAYADHEQDRATFATGVSGALLPAVPVSWKNDPTATCQLAGPGLRTARVEMVASAQEATFAVLLLPAVAVKTGRHRLWRVRDAIASALPAQSRDLLTRRRSGSFR